MSDATANGFRARYGPVALVAGAAAGLGAAYARALHGWGLDLCLVDVDAGALNALDVPGERRVLDLGEAKLLEELRLEGLEIGLLVLNAAFVPVGPFLERGMADHERAIDVNVRAAVRLVHALAPPMVARRRGGIVLTSSLAGLSGGPKLASYAGTKAYLLAFGRSLRRELRPSGVSVLTVVPGAVNTPGYRAQAGDGAAKAANPDRVAQTALRALGRKGVVTPGEGLTSTLLRALPFDAATALVEWGSRGVLKD
jgi:short-subunit dehydrogenase